MHSSPPTLTASPADVWRQHRRRWKPNQHYFLPSKKQCNISCQISQGQAACGGGFIAVKPIFTSAQETKFLTSYFFEVKCYLSLTTLQSFLKNFTKNTCIFYSNVLNYSSICIRRSSTWVQS